MEPINCGEHEGFVIMLILICLIIRGAGSGGFSSSGAE